MTNVSLLLVVVVEVVGVVVLVLLVLVETKPCEGFQCCP